MGYIVNTSFGIQDVYTEENFDTKREATEYCKKHGLPCEAIKKRKG